MPAEVTASAPATVTITIPAGKALSEPFVVKGKVCGLIVPTGWDTAAITFQGGFDRLNVFDLYDGATERTIASAQAVGGRMLSLSLNDWLCANVIRIRSGTSASAVNQTANRDIVVILAG